MASFLNYFGFGKPATVEQGKSAVRALPASWYTSPEMYELERSAIFAKRWLLITHNVHARALGDYLRYDAAGFQFVLCRHHDGQIHGFHNRCDRCECPIVTQQKGKVTTFTCQNGCSYDLDGKAASISGQASEELNNSKRDLQTIHVKSDHNGFLWVNLDSKSKPDVAWEVDFAGVDKQDRFKGFNFDEYEFDHEWEMTGTYNWKILADNYNECYHCATTHPDLKEMADLETYSVTTKDGYILHNVRGRPGGEGENRFKVHPTYFFPSTSMNVSPHFFFMQRFVPHGPTTSTMRYEVYRNKLAEEADFQAISQMYKRVMSEDKVLCERAQRNISAGVFVNGQMHPKLEQGPLFFQGKCRDTVTDFWKRQQEQMNSGIHV